MWVQGQVGDDFMLLRSYITLHHVRGSLSPWLPLVQVSREVVRVIGDEGGGAGIEGEWEWVTPVVEVLHHAHNIRTTSETRRHLGSLWFGSVQR